MGGGGDGSLRKPLMDLLCVRNKIINFNIQHNFLEFSIPNIDHVEPPNQVINNTVNYIAPACPRS